MYLHFRIFSTFEHRGWRFSVVHHARSRGFQEHRVRSDGNVSHKRSNGSRYWHQDSRNTDKDRARPRPGVWVKKARPIFDSERSRSCVVCFNALVRFCSLEVWRSCCLREQARFFMRAQHLNLLRAAPELLTHRTVRQAFVRSTRLAQLAALSVRAYDAVTRSPRARASARVEAYPKWESVSSEPCP